MTTLDDQNEKSGSSPASKISKNISDPIYGDAIYYLSILRQADHALLALDLLHHQELQLLFLSMTGAQRTEIIGRLGRLKQNAGALCDEFSAIPISLSSFKWSLRHRLPLASLRNQDYGRCPRHNAPATRPPARSSQRTRVFRFDLFGRGKLEAYAT